MRMNSNNGGVQMTNSSVTGVDKRSIDEITRFFVVSIHSKIHRGILKQNESLERICKDKDILEHICVFVNGKNSE